MSVGQGLRQGAVNMWNNELALGSGGFFHEMGSITSNLGIGQRNIWNPETDITSKAAVFGNRAKAGWVFKGKNGGDVAFRAFEDVGKGLDWERSAGAKWHNKNNVFNRSMHRMGLRGSGVGLTLNVASSTVFAIGSMREAKREGKNLGGQVAAGGMSIVKDIAIQRGIMLAFGSSTAIGLAAVGAVAAVGVGTILTGKEQGNRYLRQTRMSEFGGQVSASMHTRQAHTMRQRAMQSMQHSRFNAMRALGNEASFRHMPKARYGNSTGGIQPQPVMGY